MIVRFVAVEDSQSVSQVITTLQANAETFSDFAVQYVYVVDAGGVLTGVLPLRRLLLSTGDSFVRNVMIPDPLSVNVRASLKDLHNFFEDHGFIGVPVVD